MQDWQQTTGFQSPCAEYGEERLSLDKKFLSKTAAMFIVKASSSIPQFEIKKNDYLIVDRSLRPVHNQLVVAVIDNDFKVARFTRQSGKNILLPYQINLVNEDFDNVIIWGVITSLHRSLLCLP